MKSYGTVECMLLCLEPSLLALVTEGTLELDKIEIVPQWTGQDPLIFHMALALKRSLEQSGADSRFYAESVATALAAHLVEHYTSKNTPLKRYTGGLPPHKLKQVIAYMQAHLSERLSLETMAATVHMSPHYFASLFKQSTGVAPYQYLTQCRIDRAKQLLAQSNLTILEIAGLVGFQTQSHFTKVFRDRVGTTPKAYRNLL